MSNFRLHPRIYTDIEVEVSNGQGDTARSVVRNLSPGGIMIDGDRTFKETVSPPHGRDPMTHPVELDVRFQIPGEPHPFVSRCRLIYIRRLSQFEFNLGFRFIEVNAHHAQQLERYIFGDLQPNPPTTTHQVVGNE